MSENQLFGIGFMCSSSSRINVVGIGAPIVDLVYRVEDEFLALNGINKGDSQKAANWEHFASIIDECLNREYTPLIATGGSCSNTIKGLAALGNSSAFIGKIGDDALGTFYRENIAKLNIEPWLITTAVPTSQVAVFVTGDLQRTFLSFFGAGQTLTANEITSHYFKEAPLVHFEGYLLDDLELTERAMQLAKTSGSKVSLDLGCMRIVKSYPVEIFKFLKSYVDIAFANEDEIKQLLNLPADKGCQTLAEICPVVIVQVGKKGCWVGSKDGIFHSPAMLVEAIDTTGAGDLFACGFIHGYVKNYSLQDCAWLGNLLGGTVVTVLGAEIPEEKWPSIKEQIAKHFCHLGSEIIENR